MNPTRPLVRTAAALAALVAGASCFGPAKDAPPAGPVLPQPPAVFTEDGPDTEFALRTSSVAVGGRTLTHSYHLRVPTGYNADKTRAYPLVVWLHPWGPDNRPSALAPGQPYAGGEVQAIPTSSHPAFVYVPVCPPPYLQKNEPTAPNGGEWNSPAAKAMVLDTIRDLQNRFHVDPSRIYLMGFSMGGSGSWYLAHEYHRVTGLRFAAVVRGAGWYLNADPNREAVHRSLSLSPAWIHVGAQDTDARAVQSALAVAQDTYAWFQGRFQAAEDPVAERTAGKELTGDDGLTAEFRRLKLTTGAELRFSVYRGQGHEDLMWRDKELLDWVFAQHL